MIIKSKAGTEIAKNGYTVIDELNQIPMIKTNYLQLEHNHINPIIIGSKAFEYKDIFVNVVEDTETSGDTAFKEYNAIHEFAWILSGMRKHDSYTGYLSLEQYLTMVLEGTDFTYQVEGGHQYYALQFENLGDGESHLDMFFKMLKRWNTEFELRGKKVYITHQRGRLRDKHVGRYKMNIIDTIINSDITDGATAVWGYFGKKDEENPENSTYREFYWQIDELVEQYGIRYAKPYSNENITQEETMIEYLNNIILDSWKISTEVDIAEITDEVVQTGDEYVAVDERLGITLNTRIQKLESVYDADDKLLYQTATLGTVSFASTASGSSSQLQEVIEKIKKDYNDRITDLKQEFDNRFNDEVTQIEIDFNELVNGVRQEIQADYDAMSNDFEQMKLEQQQRVEEIMTTIGEHDVHLQSIDENGLLKSDFILKPDGFILGDTAYDGSHMAQAIVGKAGAIDLIADNVNLSNNLNVANQIKSLSLETVYANISELRTRMLVADVITANMVKFDTALIEKFTSSTAFINSLTAKSAFISNLNALDLVANRIYSDSGTNNTTIEGGYLQARGRYTRSWFGETEKNVDVAFVVRNGHIRFENYTENKRLYYSDRGISTFLRGYDDEDSNSEYHGSGVIEFFSHQFDKDVRGLTLFSNRGTIGLRTLTRDIVLDSDRHITLSTNRGYVDFKLLDVNRVGNNHFQMYVHNNPNPSDTDGLLRYGSPNTNYASGIRFEKTSAGSYGQIWITDGTGAKGSGKLLAGAIEVLGGGILDSYNIRSNRLWTQTNDSYMYLGSDLGVRVTSRGTNNGSITYRDVTMASLHTHGGFQNHSSGSNVYFGIGSSNALRITDNNHYNGGNIGWRDIEFRNWKANSHEKYKEDISEWNISVLDIFRNELQLYQYKYKDDLENNMIHRGIVLREDSTNDKFPAEWRQDDGFNGNEVMWWNTKAIQELAYENDELKDRINDLENKLNKIMEMIA